LLDLADLKLVTIKSKSTLTDLLEKLHRDSDQALSLDKITTGVEKVRKARNAKNA